MVRTEVLHFWFKLMSTEDFIREFLLLAQQMNGKFPRVVYQQMDELF